MNHETIFPGGRSSVPHAHSEDEEFVFVVEGRASLWIDGHLIELDAGDAVAFPAGTGLAHSLINNSDAPIKLLIVGERSEDDRLTYPIDPGRPSSGVGRGASRRRLPTPPEVTLGPLIRSTPASSRVVDRTGVP